MSDVTFNPEAKTKFFQAAKCLGLSDKVRDQTWWRMTELNLSPNDPTVIYLAVAGLLEAAAKTIPNAIGSVPAQVKKAAEEAVGPVTAAATANVEEHLTRLGEGIAGEIGRNAARTIRDTVDETRRAIRLRLSAHLVTAVVILGIVSGVLGFVLGKNDLSGIELKWQALTERADAKDWFSLIEANDDVASVLRGSCATGSPSTYFFNGTRVCRLPLYLDPPFGPPSSGAVASVYLSTLDWLNRWSPVELLLSGLIGGLLLRRVAKLAVGWGPLKWLLDA